VPVGWLADRLGRLPILLGCYGVVAAGLAIMPAWSPSLGLVICLFLLGACSGALYPMALAMLGDRLPEAGLARAYAWFLAMECLGSQMGTAIMGQARDWWGEASMFGVGLAAMAAVIGSWLLLVIWQQRRQSPPALAHDEPSAVPQDTLGAMPARSAHACKISTSA
jgi:MFS family permease